MTGTPLQFAASSNGDSWLLDHASDPPVVIHQANLASGGVKSTYPIADFLNLDVGSPQHSALLEILASAPRAVPGAGISPHAYLGSNRTGGLTQATTEGASDIARYESGMQIIWDVVTREIVVIFRGTVIMAPHRFNNREEGIAWGETVCRDAGWIDPATGAP